MFQLVSGGNIGDACEMKRALEGRDICLVPLELNGTSCSVPRGWAERCHGPYDVVIINRKSIRAKLQGELSSNDYLALTNDSYLAQDNVLMIRKPLINLEATNPKVRLIIPAQQLVGSEVCEFTFHTTVATGMKWLD
ncbi:hypothetical protein CDAR_21831 [Caerostris darwini]|uniref:Uncharacterized protein n=1 Tax=Caerostris darwini TaxID=1538125 RepID=A0AAV4SG87_9ARAC|nr:hypothetical protein CDAR_21831 [Caerostris darwini]